MYINLMMLKKSCAWFQRFYLARKMSCESYVANIDAYGEQGYWLEVEKVFKRNQERGKTRIVLEIDA